MLSPRLSRASARYSPIRAAIRRRATSFVRREQAGVRAAGLHLDLEAYAARAEIAVNVIAPGNRDRFQRRRGSATIRRGASSSPPIGHQAAPGFLNDIGPMIASLLSDDNRWINAQRIEMSGGQST